MSAKLAEKLAEIAAAHNSLGELYTELSALYDVESAKSGKAGGDGAAGKVPAGKGKAGVASKKNAGSSDDDGDLPEPTPAVGKKGAKAGKKKVTEDDVRAAAKKVIDKHGKDVVVKVLGGKLADVDESDYPAMLAKLEQVAEADDPDEVLDAEEEGDDGDI